MTKLTRRKFLAATGVTAVGAAAIGGPRYVFAAPGSPDTGDTVIVIHLRGGADGMHMCQPDRGGNGFENRLQEYRGNIMVQNTLPLTSGSAGGAPVSADIFGLHPEMAPLYNGLWSEGKMAIVPAAGVVVDSVQEAQRGRLKSHFEAERFTEKGSGSNAVNNGWLARMVEAQGAGGAIGSIRKTKGDSIILNGTEVVSINDLESISTDGGLGGFRDGERARPAIEQMVSGTDSISINGQRALESITSLEDLDPNVLRPNYPNDSFGQGMAEVATILRANIGLQAAAIDMNGYDNHSNINGRFGNLMGELSAALQQLSADTNGLEEITVLVTTEFGRTMRGNGGNGTDHGRGRTELILGGAVKGGVYGDYVDQLNDDLEGVDRNTLPVVNDHRKVLAEIATLRADVANADAVVPGYDPGQLLGFG